MDEYESDLIDHEKSRELALIVGAKDKNCYHNAWSALAYAPKGSWYVEGFASAIIVSMHGWIETPGEKIIDPTPCFHAEDRAWKTTYFPARRWTLEEMAKDTIEIGCLPFHSDEFGQCFEQLGYREAYRLATRHSYGEASGLVLSHMNRLWPDEWELTPEEEKAAEFITKSEV